MTGHSIASSLHSQTFCLISLPEDFTISSSLKPFSGKNTTLYNQGLVLFEWTITYLLEGGKIYSHEIPQ